MHCACDAALVDTVMVYDYLLVIRTKSLFPYILIFSPLFLAHDTSAHKVTELVSF